MVNRVAIRYSTTSRFSELAVGPLNGVRILDLTHVWAGPLATRVLADLGAEVVKIEGPMSRGPRKFPGLSIGGFIGGAPGNEPWNTNAVFVKLQRNKKSVVLDLKTDQGRRTFLELVEHADVVIENFSARAMKRLGLDYPALKRVNPQIIHVAMPGYGLSGPYRDRVAFGPTVEPMSGLTDAMGYSHDQPRNTAMAAPDPTAAVNSVAAVLTGLRHRAKKGSGFQIELSLHESAVATNGPWLVEEQIGHSEKRIGNAHPEMAPHGIYPCREDDRWVAIACRDDSDWHVLCQLIGDGLNPDLDFDQRRQKQAEIDEEIASWTEEFECAELVFTLQRNRIPAGDVRDTQAMLADAQTLHREFFVPLEQGTPMPGNPIKMTGISHADWTPCPKLGQHNREVLQEWIGMDNDSIDTLYEAGVIVDKPPR